MVARRADFWTAPCATDASASVHTPEPTSCQLTGNTATGASTKKSEASTECSTAFHATGPAKAVTATMARTNSRRSRAARNTNAAAKTADNAAPYRMVLHEIIIRLQTFEVVLRIAEHG